MKKLSRMLMVITVTTLTGTAFASDYLYQCQLNAYRKGSGGGSASGFYDLYGQVPMLRLGAGEVTASIQYTSKNGQRGILGVMRYGEKTVGSFLTYEPVKEIFGSADLNEDDHYNLECVRQQD